MLFLVPGRMRESVAGVGNVVKIEHVIEVENVEDKCDKG